MIGLVASLKDTLTGVGTYTEANNDTGTSITSTTVNTWVAVASITLQPGVYIISCHAVVTAGAGDGLVIPQLAGAWTTVKGGNTIKYSTGQTLRTSFTKQGVLSAQTTLRFELNSQIACNIVNIQIQAMRIK